MKPYDRLLAETQAARSEFLDIPLFDRALAGAVPTALYLAFLEQAYHHVRQTCPLLALAAAKTSDAGFRQSLLAYLVQEEGHEEWILEDIAALGGDPNSARNLVPGIPCQVMVGYAYYAIEWISPYALLGMVHVLESTSVLLAASAASALKASFGLVGPRGFRYLETHGELDAGHVEFFRDLVNRQPQPAIEPVVACANVIYRLYGDIFRDLERVPR